jgi:hypothetical protein
VLASWLSKFYGPYDVTLGRVLANADLRPSPEHAKMVEDSLRALEAFFAAPPAAAASAAAAQEQGAAERPAPAKRDGSVKMPPQLKSVGSSLRRPPPVEQPLAGAAEPDSPSPKVGRQISFTF